MIAALIPDSCLVEVAVLSNLAQVFGLLDSVKKTLERRRQQTDPSQEHILSTLNSESHIKKNRLPHTSSVSLSPLFFGKSDRTLFDDFLV